MKKERCLKQNPASTSEDLCVRPELHAGIHVWQSDSYRIRCGELLDGAWSDNVGRCDLAEGHEGDHSYVRNDTVPVFPPRVDLLLQLYSQFGGDSAVDATNIQMGHEKAPTEQVLRDQLYQHVLWLEKRAHGTGSRETTQTILRALDKMSKDPDIETGKQWHHAVIELYVYLDRLLNKD